MRDIIKISSYCFVEYLLIFPLLLSLSLYTQMTDIMIWLPVTYSLFVLGVICQQFLPWKNIGLQLILACIFGVITAFLFEQMFVCILIHSFIIFRGFTLARTRNILPLNYLWFGGIGLYTVFYIAFRNVDLFKEWSNLLTFAGAIYMIATMFITNQQHLLDASLSKSPTITKSIKRHNHFFLSILSIIILIFAFGKSLQQMLLTMIRTILGTIFGLLSGEENTEPMMEEPPPASMDLNMPMDIKEPSKLAKILETIMIYGVSILAGVGLLFFLLYSIKKTRKWLKKVIQQVMRWIQNFTGQASQLETVHDYVDETENLFDFKKWRKDRQEQMKDWMQNMFKRPVQWERLTNEEKVRELYKQFVRNNMAENQFIKSDTPRETAEKIQRDERDQIVETYERIRYGDVEVSDDWIKKMEGFINKNN